MNFLKKIVPNTEWDNLFAIKYDHLFSERHWSYAIGEKDRHLSSLLFLCVRCEGVDGLYGYSKVLCSFMGGECENDMEFIENRF
jgi:hypothetical protein